MDLEHLGLWAAYKGLDVIGTGDFTHPVWFDELYAKLAPAEDGMFRLNPDIEKALQNKSLPMLHDPVRFILQTEISTVYKAGGRTRKVHHIILTPDFAQADRIRKALGRIGNVASDGRPILGLDSRDLLEIVLETGSHGCLIPAHIWTPWFSMLGSRSGFDAVGECYRDLASHIFAVETGLSADPPMLWRISALDRYRFVSNSDAHSPSRLGREATVFNSPLTFFDIRQALKTGDGYAGTIEMFPQQGKYHMDGHRKCNFRCTPEESMAYHNRCPVCGKPLTLGVLHRITELADRDVGQSSPCPCAFRRLIPLHDLLSEVLGVGPASKKVGRTYEELLHHVGSELDILEKKPLAALRASLSPSIYESLQRMRAEQVTCEAGFDGAYGRVYVGKPA
jgi:DNA helicase-2/ATP-dependent DNA helicase PcrA